MSKKSSTASPIGINLSGWKNVLLNVKDRIIEDNVPIVSAGVAFYAFLAIFPGIMVLFSIYGLFLDPESAEKQITRLAEILPEQTIPIIEKRMENLMETSKAALGWGTAFGLLVALWSSNKGIKSLFKGLDISYRVDAPRGFIRHNALALAFTLGTIVVIIVSLTFIVVFPALVNMIGLPETIESLISWLRWPILALIVITAISLIYQYGPARERPGFRWVIFGATVATFCWLIASWGFSVYVSNFGNFGELYGSLSAVVIMLFWLFITSFIILAGGELNRAIETQAKTESEKPESPQT